MYKNAVVMSGGAAKGFAHLGALDALEKNGIRPDIISGTSAGALAGVLYADGYSPREILDIFNEQKLYNIAGLKLSTSSIGSLSGMRKLMKKILRATRFEQLSIPVIVAATNLNTGSIRYFSTGDIMDPLMASASIPLIFRPVMIEGHIYVDGGVLDFLPSEPVFGLAETLIGIDVNPGGHRESIGNMIQIAERVFHLGFYGDDRRRQERFDLLVEPAELENYMWFDISKAPVIYDIGFNATGKALREYKKQA
jgi:NTE family protein